MRWGIRPGEDTVSLPLSLYYVMVVGRCMCQNNRDQPEHQSQHLDTALRSGLQPLVFACTVFHTDAPQIRSQKRSLGSPQAPHHLVYYTGQYCTIQNISSSLSTLLGHPGVTCIRQHCKSDIVDAFTYPYCCICHIATYRYKYPTMQTPNTHHLTHSKCNIQSTVVLSKLHNKPTQQGRLLAYSCAYIAAQQVMGPASQSAFTSC